jgi:hypothetical protein
MWRLGGSVVVRGRYSLPLFNNSFLSLPTSNFHVDGINSFDFGKWGTCRFSTSSIMCERFRFGNSTLPSIESALLNPHKSFPSFEKWNERPLSLNFTTDSQTSEILLYNVNFESHSKRVKLQALAISFFIFVWCTFGNRKYQLSFFHSHLLFRFFNVLFI